MNRRAFAFASVSLILSTACASTARTTTESTQSATTQPPAQATIQVTAQATTVPAKPTEASVAKPTEAPKATATPKPPAATPTVKAEIKLDVVSYTNYSDTIGYTWFVGEVKNTGNAPASSVQLALSLLDDKGNVLGSTSTNIASRSVVAPNEMWPFKMMIDKAPKEWKEVKFQAQGQAYKASAFDMYTDFKIDGITLKAPTNQYEE